MTDSQLQDRQQWMGILARAEETSLAQFIDDLGKAPGKMLMQQGWVSSARRDVRSIGVKPAMERMGVDFPDPEAPIKATISQASSDSETSFRTSIPR